MNSSQGKNEFYEKQLEFLANYLEGEVDCRLPQKRYRLSVCECQPKSGPLC